MITRWIARAALSLILTAPAFAQMGVPNHGIPVSRGAGSGSFKSVGPCLAGIPIVGAGLSADPICGAAGYISLANTLAASRLATAAALPNTPTYANGASGVGATLTAGANSTLTVDGSVANLNDVIVVKNQASAFQNGIYTVTDAGSGAAPWVLTRATYFDVAAEMVAGSNTFITAGSTNANFSMVLPIAVATVGTDPVIFNPFSAGSAVTSVFGRIGAIAPVLGDYTGATVTYTPSGTGASTLTAGTRFSNLVNLIDYGNNGDVCNGTIDDAPTFARAVAALSTLTGTAMGGIVLPYGNCTLGSAVNIPARTAIIGQGHGTNICTTSATANMFDVTGGNVVMRDFQMSYCNPDPGPPPRTAGSYIYLLSGGGDFRNIHMSGPYYGIVINDGSTKWLFDRITMENVIYQGIACSKSVLTVDFGTISNSVISGVDRLLSNAGYWTDSCGDISINNLQVLGFISGIVFDAAAGKDIADNYFSNIIADNNGTYGFYVRANALDSSVSRNMFVNFKTTSNLGNGVDIGDAGGIGRIDGLYFSNLMSDNNGNLGLNAVKTGANVKLDLHIIGGQIAGNSGSGMSIGADVTDFVVTGMRIGPAGSWPENGGAGIVIAAGTGNKYVIGHNNLTGNLVGPGLTNGATGTNKITGANVCDGGAC